MQLDYSLPFKAVQPAPDYAGMIQNAMSISEMLDARNLRRLQGRQIEQEMVAFPAQTARKAADLKVKQNKINYKLLADIGSATADIDFTAPNWKEQVGNRIKFGISKGALPADLMKDFDQWTPDNFVMLRNISKKYYGR